MLRKASLALLVAGLLLGIAGTGAMSATEADRGITVAVADDDEAYVGLRLSGKS